MRGPAGALHSASPDASLTASAHEDPIRRLLEKHMPWLVHEGLFSTHFFSAGPCPDQGWKLHVSATPWSAVSVLMRSLPILLEFGVSSKMVNTRLHLLQLNNGLYGHGQVGKFITVYPSNDKQALQLAVALHEATDGLPGPRIRTDRPLRPGSLVHYRYGAFRRLSAPTPNSVGANAPDAVGELRDSTGRRYPDRREDGFHAPFPDVVDPFEANGIYVRNEPRAALAGRYLVVDVLGSSACGGVYRAIDVGAYPPRACVLKEFWRDAGGDLYGGLAPDWGNNEAELLARHNGDPEFPQYFDRFELDGNLFIVLEYIDGQSLAQEIEARENRGDPFSLKEIVQIGAESARALSHLHKLGMVFRDFNPANLICTPHGDYRLVDYGIAHEEGVSLRPGLARRPSPRPSSGKVGSRHRQMTSSPGQP